MIVDLIEHKGLLLAASSLGEIIGWTILPRNSHRFFQTSISNSIVSPAFKAILDPSELLGIVSLDNHVVAYNRKGLFVVDSNKLKDVEKQGSHLARVIKAGKILADGEYIKSVAGVDSQRVLLGTNKGSLLLVNILEQTVEKTLALYSQAKKDKQTLAFGTTFQKHIQVTSISLFFDKSRAMISLDNGKLFVIDIETFRVINEITQNLKQPLERINKVYLKEKENKVYTLHNSYILEWNFMLNRCMSSVQYHSPQGIIAESNNLAIVGSNSSLTLLTESVKSVELTMRGAGAIYQLGNMMLVGGADNLVDIIQNGARVMTLISK